MSTIVIKDMTFYYDKFYKNVFTDINLNLNTDWKLGLVGRNGRGKTTLLNLLNRELEPSKGLIHVPLNTEKFPYSYKRSYSKTIDVVKENIANYHELESKMKVYIGNWNEENSKLYGNVLEEYERLEGFTIDTLIEKEFNLIGLTPDTLYREFDTLSGGEKHKALIVAMFLRKNSFLLIDEPTNHLDIEGRKKLSQYLFEKKGFIVVSHDRSFLDGCIDHVLSINKEAIYIEKGNFSSWHYNKTIKDEYELRTKKNIEKQVKVLEEAAGKNRRWSNDKEKEKIGCKGDKGAIGATAARLMKRAINIERRTNNMLEEKKSLLKDYEELKELDLVQRGLDEEIYVSIKDLSFSYSCKNVIDKLSIKIYKGDRLWIRGSNGCGKTTFLKILCGELKHNSGKMEISDGLKIAIGYQDLQWTQGFLDDLLKKSNINTSKFREVLSYFDIDDEYFERPIETFSQGELKKVDISRALCTDNHLFIWDEPLNYMDILFRTQLEKAILDFEPTVVFVEHDQSFGNRIANKVLDLGN